MTKTIVLTVLFAFFSSLTTAQTVPATHHDAAVFLGVSGTMYVAAKDVDEAVARAEKSRQDPDTSLLLTAKELREVLAKKPSATGTYVGELFDALDHFTSAVSQAASHEEAVHGLQAKAREVYVAELATFEDERSKFALTLWKELLRSAFRVWGGKDIVGRFLPSASDLALLDLGLARVEVVEGLIKK